jgi:hypothetical protein
MRRIIVVAALVAGLMALGAGAGFAQVAPPATIEEDGVSVIKASNQRIQCTGVPCIATGRDDLVLERIGNGKKDRIILRGGDDQVRANNYGNDQDVIRGTSGFDLIYVNDGDIRDRIFGGKGKDKCVVDIRSEVVAGCSRILVR